MSDEQSYKSDGELHDSIAVGVAAISENGIQKGVIGLSLMKRDLPFPDDLQNPENYNDLLFLTLPAAKAMLVDLRDAIESIQSGEDFK